MRDKTPTYLDPKNCECNKCHKCYEKLQIHCVALELALNKSLAHACCEKSKTIISLHDMHCVGFEALSGSKMGALFEVFLKQHEIIGKEGNPSHSLWLEAEALKKECGL